MLHTSIECVWSWIYTVLIKLFAVDWDGKRKGIISLNLKMGHYILTVVSMPFYKHFVDQLNYIDAHYKVLTLLMSKSFLITMFTP